MNVAGRYYRNIKFLTKLYDLPVKLSQILFGSDVGVLAVSYKKRIVFNRLYFQIIVESSCLLNAFPWVTVFYC